MSNNEPTPFEQARLDHVATLSTVLKHLRENPPVPTTPEEEHGREKKVDDWWQVLSDSMEGLIVSALQFGMVDKRSEAIRVAIDRMTEKITEYPSTPYTANAVESLAGMLRALELSLELAKKEEAMQR